MAYYYTNKFLLDTSKENKYRWFETDRKKELNQIEKIGLEHVLQDFITEYEEDNFGEVYTNIIDYTRWNTNSVDILDGYSDTYIFDTYAIECIYCTNNGIILLECSDLETFNGEDEEEKERFFDTDILDRVSGFDRFENCDTAIFRLN